MKTFNLRFLVGAMLAAGFAVTFSGCYAADPSYGAECAGEPDDGVACTLDVCPADGVAYRHLPFDAACGVGQMCSATAGCVTREPACPASCDDGVACTADACVDGACRHATNDDACPDGATCRALEADGVSGCYTPPPVACDDGCDDSVACTVDVCSGDVCRFIPDATACPSGQHCAASGCVNDAPVTCEGGCDDHVACTVDSCDGSVCRHAMNDSACPSGQHCAASGCVNDTTPPPTGGFECAFADGANRIGYSVRLCARGMTSVHTVPDVDNATRTMSGSSMRVWTLGADVPAGGCRDYDLTGITGGINTHPFIGEWRVASSGHPEWDRDILNVADFREFEGHSAASVGLEAYVCQRAAGCAESQWILLPEAFYTIAPDTVGARFWSEDPNLSSDIRGTVAIRAVLQTSCEEGLPTS
jgi:hypothetical protein